MTERSAPLERISNLQRGSPAIPKFRRTQHETPATSEISGQDWVVTTAQRIQDPQHEDDDYLVQYERYDLDHPDRWVMYVSPSNEPVIRLVVFVHGFGGKSVKTWLDFPRVDLARADNGWWRESDLLFVGYSSTRDSITAVANRIRSELHRFYPKPHKPALVVEGEAVRKNVDTPYLELVVVGHSLGGVVLRRALCDAAKEWRDNDGSADPHVLLGAQIRLFSPASSGFRAAGWLGFVRATSYWSAVEAFLCRSSAYSDLQPGSRVLMQLQNQTEQFIRDDTGGSLAALKARTVWANPDDIVIDLDYETDYASSSWDGYSHTSICKPQKYSFSRPWRFVQTGKG